MEVHVDIKYIHVPLTKKMLHSISFIFLRNISFGRGKETSQRDVSFTHPLHMFKKIIMNICLFL